MSEKLELIICLVLYLFIGGPILLKAARNIRHGEIFDENFLMVVATIGAFCVAEYDEAVMVMVLYRIGEYLQDKAIDKSRRSITDLMDIRPDSANKIVYSGAENSEAGAENSKAGASNAEAGADNLGSAAASATAATEAQSAAASASAASETQFAAASAAAASEAQSAAASATAATEAQSNIAHSAASPEAQPSDASEAQSNIAHSAASPEAQPSDAVPGTVQSYTETKVDPESLTPGDFIIIRPGERIPVDCTVTEGDSRVDTAAISGEALPAVVGPGAQLYSGSINIDGLLTAKVDKPADESTANRILELVEEAADNKAQAENFITKFAKVYTPVVCGLALVVAVIPPLFVGGWSEWIHRALTFLIISCPCALVISIPLAFFAGIGGASGKGILIKGGNYLEALSKAKIIAMDKTGTITRGVFKVVAVHPSDCDEARLLELATLAESFSNHPIARSLADAYGDKPDKSRVSEFREIAGKGVLAKVDKHHVAAGNRKIMEMIGCEYHDCDHLGTRVHVALDGHYMGHVIISDELKSDSAEAVAALKSYGLTTLLLTGDKEDMAAEVAAEVGISEYKSELMPQDKLSIVEEKMKGLGPKEKLAFVGDGINDAPVLTRADIGIAMGGMGSAAAVEAADIVLMNDRPSDIALAVRHSKKIMKLIYEDISFSLGIKVVVLIAAVFGYSPMWLAVFADVGVCMIAILNSMRGLKVK